MSKLLKEDGYALLKEDGGALLVQPTEYIESLSISVGLSSILTYAGGVEITTQAGLSTNLDRSIEVNLSAVAKIGLVASPTYSIAQTLKVAVGLVSEGKNGVNSIFL